MASSRRKQTDQMSFFPGSNSSEPNGDENDNFKETDLSSATINGDEQENEPDAEVAPEHTVKPHQLDGHTETAVQVTFEEADVKKRRIDFRYENSIILTFLAFLGATVTRVFKNSFTVAIFTAYQRTAGLFRDSFFYKLIFNQKTERFSANTKKRVRRTATEAVIPSTFSRLNSALMLIKTRSYAFILLTFGITAMLIHFFLSGTVSVFINDPYAPLTSAIMIVAAIWLLPHGKSLSETVKESFILSTLFFVFLGIKHPSFSDNDEVHFPISGGLLIGIFLGATTLFFPVHSVLITILTVIYTVIVIKYPETGLISLILILPILKNEALVYICIVITVAYIFKILTGKRTPSFEFSDIFVALFLLLNLLSELVTYGDIQNPLMSSSFILVYFLCICILRDSVWFDRAINAIILDACVLSAYSVLVTFLGKGLELSIDYIPNTDLGSVSSSAFDSLSVLSVLLVVSMFYMLAAAFSTKSKSNRFGFLLLSIAAAIFLMREASITVKLAFIIAFMLFMVLRSSKFFILIILTVAILPLLPLFNGGIYSGFVELLKSEAYRLDIWNSVITMLGSFGFIGIGNAPNAFSEIYSTFYVGNASSIPHAHSLIFQLSISLGFIGILLFMMIVFFIAQGAFSYGRNCTDKKSKNRLFCYSAMCSVFAMVIIGLGEHLWYNPRMGLVFWLICGMSVCARRSASDLTASAEIMMELEENYNG